MKVDPPLLGVAEVKPTHLARSDQGECEGDPSPSPLRLMFGGLEEAASSPALRFSLSLKLSPLMTDAQFGRELEEDEVLRINLILKRRATRYIAAAEEDWLYPEQRASTTHWSKLDNDWFLLPHLWKVQFTTGFVAGYQDGSRFAMDEYGLPPGHPEYADKQRAEKEWDLHQRAQRAWARKRAGRSVAHVDDTMKSDRVGDELMREYLEGQGIRPRPKPRGQPADADLRIDRRPSPQS